MRKDTRPGRISETISRRIRKALTDGRLAPGEKLPAEREMAQRLRASRVSVREAYRSLAEAGLVSIRRGAEGGAFIADFDPAPMSRNLTFLLRLGRTSHEELTEARVLLEPSVARLAARRAGREDVAAPGRAAAQGAGRAARQRRGPLHPPRFPPAGGGVRAEPAPGHPHPRHHRARLRGGAGHRDLQRPPRAHREPSRADLRGHPQARRGGGGGRDAPARARRPGQDAPRARGAHAPGPDGCAGSKASPARRSEGAQAAVHLCRATYPSALRFSHCSRVRPGGRHRPRRWPRGPRRRSSDAGPGATRPRVEGPRPRGSPSPPDRGRGRRAPPPPCACRRRTCSPRRGGRSADDPRPSATGSAVSPSAPRSAGSRLRPWNWRSEPPRPITPKRSAIVGATSRRSVRVRSRVPAGGPLPAGNRTIRGMCTLSS